MKLRDYQEDCISDIYYSLKEKAGNPLAVIPTGGGKSIIIAKLCSDIAELGGRILVLSHVKEILQQIIDKLVKLVNPRITMGAYSASLKMKSTKETIIVAGIQSIYKRAFDIGKFDLIIVDEAHLIPTKDEGMYRSFINDSLKVNPDLKIVGFTATPYRLKGRARAICGKKNVFRYICHETTVKELINKKYLSPLITKTGRKKVDLTKAKIKAGEYDLTNLDDAACSSKLVKESSLEILDKIERRKSILIFCGTVKHAKKVANALEVITNRKESIQTIFGDTLPMMRDEIINDFKNGNIRFLVNVNVLTTGFDAPNIDCVVLLRPTLSPGLYYQMVGRGFRLHPGKENCLILDYGENIARHGPVDSIRVLELDDTINSSTKKNTSVVKECPSCDSIIARGFKICPDCGHFFTQERDVRHQTKASTENVISEPQVYSVVKTDYFIHEKQGWKFGDPLTMRVEYQVGLNKFIKEWICFEHKGRALDKAAGWWIKRTNADFPTDSIRAVEIANQGSLLEPTEITVVDQSNGFKKIVKYVFPETTIEEEESIQQVNTVKVLDPIKDDELPF